MDPTEHKPSTFVERSQRSRNYLARRSKYDRGIKSRRRFVERIANPNRSEFFGEFLMTSLVARCDVYIRAASSGDLNADVTSGSESVNSKPRIFPVRDIGEPERPVSDNSGAH
jgi:hypothetical protein